MSALDELHLKPALLERYALADTGHLVPIDRRLYTIVPWFVSAGTLHVLRKG